LICRGLKKPKDSVAFATESSVWYAVENYLRTRRLDCLVLLFETFCPLSLNLSACLLWRVTYCGLFDLTWEVVTHWSQWKTESEKSWHIYDDERMV